MSLRNKFLILVLISLIVPISVIGIFVNSRMVDVIDRDITQINKYLMEKVYLQMESELLTITDTFSRAFDDNTFGYYLMGSTNVFQPKIDELVAKYPELKRVYVLPAGIGLEMSQPGNYPPLPEGKVTPAAWETVWQNRPIEQMPTWDGPYKSPDGENVMVYVGPAYSLGRVQAGIASFEVSIEGLKAQFIGDVETKSRHLYFLSQTGKEFLTGKDYSRESFFREIVQKNTAINKRITLAGKSYLVCARPIPVLNSYLIILEEQNSAFASSRAVSKFILLISLCTLAVAMLVLIYFVQRVLIRPLEKLQRVAGLVAAGDLTVHSDLNGHDELGKVAKSFDAMTDSLKHVISLLSDTSIDVQKASDDLYQSFEQMASSNTQNNKIITEFAHITENQSFELAESSRRTRDIFSSLKEFAARMHAVMDNSDKVMTSANQGQNVIKEAVDKISLISDNVRLIANGMDNLKEKSNEINEITDLITQITEQTNLLALNASIEAARAGAAGAGFAVVAEEIRNLANQSRKAAERINQLIDQVQMQVEQVRTEVQSEVVEFNQGAKLINQAGGTFGEIVQDIRTINGMNKEMNQHINDIASAGEAIDKNVTGVAAQASETAASAEEIAANSEENLRTIQYLSTLVSRLDSLSKSLGELKSKFTI